MGCRTLLSRPCAQAKSSLRARCSSPCRETARMAPGRRGWGRILLAANSCRAASPGAALLGIFSAGFVWRYANALVPHWKVGSLCVFDIGEPSGGLRRKPVGARFQPSCDFTACEASAAGVRQLEGPILAEGRQPPFTSSPAAHE